MLSLLFSVFMLVVFGKLLVYAVNASWGIAKILLTVVFLPIILVVMAVVGLMSFALPVLLIVGICTFVKAAL